MSTFEYKVVPAPLTGTKAKGVKTVEDRFALSLTDLLNEMAAEGWEYFRADSLPCEVRKGLTKREIATQNVLIFRRMTGPSPLQTIIETRETLPPLTLEDRYEERDSSPTLGPASRE